MTSFAVIGDPLAHSLSPALFHWLFTALGISAEYRPRQTPANELTAALDEVRSGRWQGLSVTLPHKEAMAALVDDVSPLAARAGAVNCVVVHPFSSPASRLIGHNTDVTGVRRALEHAGVPLVGRRVLILGAGGAARAAVVAAHDAASIHVANRTLDRARALARALGLSSDAVVGLNASSLAAPLSQADVLIQATRAGLDNPTEDALPPECVLSPRLTVFDMVYRPLTTALLHRASQVGAQPVDGLWMLVYQALEQLTLWTGQVSPEGMAGRLHEYLRQEAR